MIRFRRRSLPGISSVACGIRPNPLNPAMSAMKSFS